MNKAAALLIAIATILTLVVAIVGCADPEDIEGTIPSTAETMASGGDWPTTIKTATDEPVGGDAAGGDSATADDKTVTYAVPYSVIYDGEDLDDTWNRSAASFITLADGSIRFDGSGATASGNKVTITAGGTYVVSGRSTDGQIVVDLKEKGVVRLVLSGADLACLDSAPIYVKKAVKTVITLAEGTENYVADRDSYVLEDAGSDEPDGAVFSKDDLTINGTGSLTVAGNYNHGIVGRDDLKIISGTITVDAAGDAIRGKDCIGVKDGTITVTAEGDGMQASNDVDRDKGYVDIQGGVIDITAGTDGIQAESTLLVAGGDITLSTGGGSANSSSDPNSGWGQWGREQAGRQAGAIEALDADTDTTTAKGLKAAGAVFVTEGVLVIDSSDDSVHSNGSLQIDGGDLTLTSGDDGLHADGTIDINGGTLTITKSYEGIESGVITLTDGTVRVVASDDGINVAGGVDDSSVSGRRGQGAFTVNENNKLYIDGGYLVIDANGDGIDCNGRVFMTGGTVVIEGPTNDGNGPIDYLGEFTISGGHMVAVGSSGMAQAPSQSSTQRSIMVGFESAQAAGTLIHIEDEDGNDILTFDPTKEYESVLLCSAEIRDGGTYVVYVGGTSTGTARDGVYSGGSYSPGTEYVTLIASSMVTTYGSFGGMGAMMGDFAPDDAGQPNGGGVPNGGGFPGGTHPDRGTMPDDRSFPE